MKAKIRLPFIFIISVVLSACGEHEPIQINQWRINTGKNFVQPIKVLHISDIHYKDDGSGPAAIAQLAQIVKITEPNIIAITGDLTGEGAITTDRIRPSIIDGLESLSENDQTYVVLGNHDSEEWFEALSASSLRLIEGKTEILTAEGHSLCIRGLQDSFSRGYSHVPFSHNCNGFKLTLTHDPYAIELEAEEGLYLAGHTHCGQIRLPVIGALWIPTSASEKYHCGYGSEGEKVWIVSSGVGTTFVDVRMGTAASVELVELY
ncbi:metallophosphoesterase [Vibrio harveyi]|uniref:metallophosphoesterase n=1 Tax=Vibrio harveyi TaxID=669 RepID=UPI000DF2C0F4|nr:metallophosphoesterase [Vibrio harveyi]RCR64341.1 hypothetical protein DTW68_05675 [Vibrio harveyi]